MSVMRIVLCAWYICSACVRGKVEEENEEEYSFIKITDRTQWNTLTQQGDCHTGQRNKVDIYMDFI